MHATPRAERRTASSPSSRTSSRPCQSREEDEPRLLVEHSVLEEVHNLFDHIGRGDEHRMPVWYDEKIRHALYASPLHPNLAIVWLTQKRGEPGIPAAVARDH